jgi:hypothetical protein
MSDNHKEKRDLQRADPLCEEEFSLKPEVLPDPRKAKDCDVPSAPPAADPFVFPVQCPPDLPPGVSIPTPINIPNEEVSVHCGDDTYEQTTPPKPSVGNPGYEVTVNAGTIVRQLHFTELPGINGNQLTFLSTLSEEDRDTLIADGVTLETVVGITGLPPVLAQTLIDTVVSIKETLAEDALQLALDQISCYYENVKQVAWCDPTYPDADSAVTDGDESTPDLTADPNTPPGTILEKYVSSVNNPSVVVAGQFRSPASQLAADTLAMDAAEAALGCLFCNDEITQTCEDIGFSEAVSTGVTSLDDQVTVGSVTIDANTICSHDSKEDANDQATSIASAQLVCFYINPTITVDCASIGRQAGSPGIDGPPYGDFLNNIRGQVITVPEGYVVSLISTADATSIAYELAVAMLDCWICNEPVIITCPPETVIDGNGDPIIVEAANNSLVTVEACEIKADTLAEANSQAADRAQSLLDCTYCNPAIQPKCVIGGSIDETVSVAAGTYCCPGAGGAQTCYEIAVSTAIPVIISNQGIDCRYCNEEQCTECTDENHPPLTEGCHAVGGPFCLPAGVFCIGESQGGLIAANTLAMDLAIASLICFYTNSTDRDVGTEENPRVIKAGTALSLSCDNLEEVIEGIPGADGAPGADGKDGEDGRDGYDGSPGSSGSCNGTCYGFYS